MDKSSLQTMYIPPSQRLHHRLTAPLIVKIGNRAYRTADWSLQALRIQDRGECKDLGTTEALVSIPFQGMELRMPVMLQFQRFDDFTNQTVFSFAELSERQRDTLRLFIEELVRGTMVSSSEMIQRLDMPTTPVQPLDKLPPAKQEPPKRRWQSWFFTGFYLLAGIALTGYLGLMGYANFVKMEVQTAWLSTPTQTLGSVVEGRVGDVPVQEGQVVQRGALLARISDPNLERDIDAARMGLSQQAQVQFDQAQRAETLRSRVRTLSQEAAVLENELRRQVQLAAAGAIPPIQADQARLSLERTRNELRAARANLGELDRVLRERSVQDVNNRTLRILQAQQKRLDISAPFDGRVVKILKTEGTAVRQGEAVLILQRNQDPTVEAYVTQQQSLQLAINDTAEVVLPGARQRFKAKVRQIEPVSATDTNNSIPFDQRLLGIRVTLRLANPSQARTVQENPTVSGTPVVVIFQRHRSLLGN